MGDCRVTFQPGDHRATVAEGTNLLTAAIAAGVRIRSECGGEGVCGQCKVIVRDGPVTADPGDRLTEAERCSGCVLACRATVHGDAQIEVPPESRREGGQVLIEEGGVAAPMFAGLASVQRGVELVERVPYTPSALSAKLFLQLPPPTADDNISDLDRLERGIRRARDVPQMQMGLAELRRLPRLLRDADWRVTVTLGQRGECTEVVMVEPGDTGGRNFAVVLDIGTTTVVASLVDLNARQVLGTKGTLNPQATYGEDVITRIIYAGREDGLQRLHQAAIAPINEMIGELAAEGDVVLNEITAVLCAGNTTMTHLLLRVDPAYLRRDPYVPSVRAAPVIRAAEAGIHINPRGLLACLDGVSSYVGGDITAGVLASGIDRLENPRMLIDLGTNGEIVLGNRDWLVCCSASAGPAFEGGGVRCGTLAMEGAIQRVEIGPGGDEVTCTTIGDGPAVGICGSGYLDLLAELMVRGVVDRQGAIRSGLATWRVRAGEDGQEFLLVAADDSATGRDIVITQTDIESLIRTKGAIFSAARVLVKAMGMEFEQVEKIHIGGGFGNYMNIGKAICIGLLPDLPEERFEFIGNSSLAGARMALLSYDALLKTREIADRMTNIELSNDASYMDEYMASLFLPHTDIGLFPTVRERLEGVAP